MKLPQRIKTPLSLLIIFIVIVLLLWICSPQPEEPLRVVRTLASSTNDVSVLWFRQDIPTLIATDTEGVAYATGLFGNNSLIAFNAKSGSTKWKIDLLSEHSGVSGSGILANQNTVFVATSVLIDAYETTTGELKWSTRLGGGHVSVIPQLDADILRVYYGDKLIEIDPETGKILASKPRGSIVWVTGNIILHAPSINQLSAFDGHYDRRLWYQGRSLFITEGWTPQDSEKGVLIAGYQAYRSLSLVEGICALNLRADTYNWCRTENYISNIAIDQQAQLGYIMRADFVLEIIDLQTGDILEEIRFLPSILPEEMMQQSQSYSITLSDGVVIVSFSDSDQTFGLKINQWCGTSHD